eukprot:COSAG02_NODE_56996_length_282_cov_1.382514_1_plen_31_part_01
MRQTEVRGTFTSIVRTEACLGGNQPVQLFSF